MKDKQFLTLADDQVGMIEEIRHLSKSIKKIEEDKKQLTTALLRQLQEELTDKEVSYLLGEDCIVTVRSTVIVNREIALKKIKKYPELISDGVLKLSATISALDDSRIADALTRTQSDWFLTFNKKGE